MKKHFFISYTGADQQWAEWVAWQLKEAKYTVIIQAWDFKAGGNFIVEMHKAAKETVRTIAILSPRYDEALYTQPEWAAALVQDPAGSKRLLIPVRIEDFQPDGLFASLIYIDLVRLSDTQANERLLTEINKSLTDKPVPPSDPPGFPGSALRTNQNQYRFPGTLPQVCNLLHRNPNFTGRDQVLLDIRESLSTGHHTALTQQAI